MFDTADYELVWPRQLFLDEANALLRRSTTGPSFSSVSLRLLEEAFLGTPTAADLEFIPTSTPGLVAGDRQLLQTLVDRADQLRSAPIQTLYFSQRNKASELDTRALSADSFADLFVRLINDLELNGYFEHAFPTPCVDDPSGLARDPSTELELRLGVPTIWPLEDSRRNGVWGPPIEIDRMYDLIEVFHDLVARARHRTYHGWDDCGWHYSDFAVDVGRRLYRWRVNSLLGASTIPYRLADTGEDVGRLVAITDDGRRELLASQTQRSDELSSSVRHAIALFRSRTAGREEKRSAVNSLARILEKRRSQLREELLTKDEGALFEIANRFDIRHSNTGQQSQYDDAFLDWIFYWYLATIELTDQLNQRSASPVTTDEPF